MIELISMKLMILCTMERNKIDKGGDSYQKNFPWFDLVQNKEFVVWFLGFIFIHKKGIHY